jgi:hypothetical protein
MPRRRTRKTDRKPQEERRLRVRSVRRGTPDAHKLSRAFIGLALARAEAEAQAQAGAAREPEVRKQRAGQVGGDAENGAK